MPENVFVYGTLMEPRIIGAVIGRIPTGEPGHLQGYLRRCIQGELYPGIRPEAGAETPGLLYRDLAPGEILALDRFEGELYERTEVMVGLDIGGQAAAGVYLIRPEYRHRLTGEPWDYEAFRTRFLGRFTNEYQGFGHE